MISGLKVVCEAWGLIASFQEVSVTDVLDTLYMDHTMLACRSVH